MIHSNYLNKLDYDSFMIQKLIQSYVSSSRIRGKDDDDSQYLYNMGNFAMFYAGDANSKKLPVLNAGWNSGL